MFTINLHNLIFHAFHGVYTEERILGNDYEVNVSVSFEADGTVTSLHDTINYVSVYEVVKKQMVTPVPLLEMLAQQMVHEIHKMDGRIKSITVTVEKKNPPIANMQGSVGVKYSKNY